MLIESIWVCNLTQKQLKCEMQKMVQNQEQGEQGEYNLFWG